MKEILLNMISASMVVWTYGLIFLPHFTGTRVGEISRDFMSGFNEHYKEPN